jgi:crossover junction endodeoxyribonuclease RusA
MGVEFEIKVRTVSEANNREHWGAKARRAKQQRGLAALVIRQAINAGYIVPRTIAMSEKTEIKLTRVGKRKLDSDNLARSCKAVRDGIADAIGIDDGDERLEWIYAQEIGKEYAVRVSIQ